MTLMKMIMNYGKKKIGMYLMMLRDTDHTLSKKMEDLIILFQKMPKKEIIGIS